MTTPADAPAGPGTPQSPARTRPAPKATTPPKQRRASTWEPDVRWSHPLEAAMWCYFLALVVDVPEFGIPPLLLALVAPVGAAVGAGRARRAFPEHEFGPQLGDSMRVLAITASFAAAGWLVYACWDREPSGMAQPIRSVGLLALITVWFGGWYWVLRSSAPKVAAKVLEEREEALIERATATWTDIFAAANLPLRVVETRPTRAGYVIGVEPLDDTKPVSFSTLQNATTELTTKAASFLAREGVQLRAGDIRPEETEAAHVHLIHVCTKQILRESIPFEPFEDAPGTIADPIDFGLYEDGLDAAVCFGGDTGGVNGLIVGATGSGKSVLTNVLIARVGECGDVLLGVVATAKLVPLVYPWIKPWLEGKTERPAIDFVAGQDPEEVLLMLAAVYQIVCDYNAQLSNEPTHAPTPEAPAVVLFVEEAGKLAIRPEKIVTHNGLEVGFSALVHLIAGECRSAQTSLLLLNQMALFGSFGEFGSEIQRNTPWRVCLKTLSHSDGQNTLPGISGARSDTTRLRHHSMLVQPAADEPRAMAAKAYNLGTPGGDPIEPIATRNGSWRPGLDPDIAGRLGGVWSGRWDASRLPELAAAAKRDGLTWPVGHVEDEIDVAWRKFNEHTSSEQGETPVENTHQAAPSGGGQFPDAEAGIAELAAIANRPALTLPEPLAAVMALLRDEQAPKDFIGTRQLALLLGWVDPDADDETVNSAAARLGREMAAIDDEIRTDQRKAVRGYDIPKLKTIAARIAREGGRK